MNSTKFSLKASRAEIRFHSNPGLSKPSFERPSPGRHYVIVHGVIFEYNLLWSLWFPAFAACVSSESTRAFLPLVNINYGLLNSWSKWGRGVKEDESKIKDNKYNRPMMESVKRNKQFISRYSRREVHSFLNAFYYQISFSLSSSSCQEWRELSNWCLLTHTHGLVHSQYAR